MQKDIHYYEKLIQEKRKKTPWREFVREMASWTTLNFYKRDGMACRYPPTNRITHLWKNFWEEAPDIDCNIKDWTSFFSHFKQFQDKIPLAYTVQFANENCEYTDSSYLAYNCYLSFAIWLDSKEVLYSAFSYDNIEKVYNSFLVWKQSSNVYQSSWIMNSYNIFYSKYITWSHNIWFSTNMIGCQECIWCDGLQNQKYHIWNVAYEKEEYEKKKIEILRDKSSYLKSYSHIKSRKAINFASENVEWNYIIESSNILNGGWIFRLHEGRNLLIINGGDGSRNCYDSVDFWVNCSNYCCVNASAWPATNVFCSWQIAVSSFIYYSYMLESCHHCLWCIWLKNKSYCIFNKQYTKEEWEEKACEIFASMEADGTLGDFFPASMNPFYFNDTLAYLIDDSFTKEEVEVEGYLWRDEPIRADIPEGMRVVKNTELDQFQRFRDVPVIARNETIQVPGTLDRHAPLRSTRDDETSGTEQWYIDPEILNVVISDEKWNYYRIVKMEYDFLMKHGLPLPTMHWLDRMKMGFR